LKEILHNASKPTARPSDEEEISTFDAERSFEQSWLT
jgi:hypothetical protein